jgi:hypothetical protein
MENTNSKPDVFFIARYLFNQAACFFAKHYGLKPPQM